MSSLVRWVAWTSAVAGPRAPASASNWVGVSPVAASAAWFSACCSDRWACSGPPWAASATTGRSRAGTALTECAATPTRRPSRGTRRSSSTRSRQFCTVPSENRCWTADSRGAETAGQVGDVQQVRSIPACCAASATANPMAFGSLYATPARLVVQVVKLPDGGVAGADQFHVGGEGQVPQGVRVQPVGE